MSEVNRMFAGYEIDFPFGPAAGAINGPNAEEIRNKIRDVIRSPAGFALWGSLTWTGGLGNDHYGRTYYHNYLTGQTVNSMGLPNVSINQGVKIQRELGKEAEAEGKPLIPSISPGKDEDPLVLLPGMAYALADSGAKIIEVNYSCPNKITGEGREPILGYELDTMLEIDDAIARAVGHHVLIIAKLPLYVAEKRALIPAVADGFGRARGRRALGLSNTLGNQQILTEFCEPALDVPGNLGGLSGPALKETARDQLVEFRSSLPEEVRILSYNGVDSGREIYHRVDELGADLAGGVTVLWENEKRGQSFGQTLTELAEEYAEEPSGAVRTQPAYREL
jgi:dihydroorotate dehydrogenase